MKRKVRKSVLFIIGTLQSGGVSKSIVNLLGVFDRKKYETHLLVMSPNNNVFGKYIPQDVTIHYQLDIADLHNGFRGLLNMLKRCCVLLAIGSLLRMILSRFDHANAGVLMAKLMPKFTEEKFDLIVDYGGQQQLYYMVSKLRGKRKVTFFHSDYSKWAYYYKADKKYYSKVDAIYTISEKCAKVLKEWFPMESQMIHVMENISSPAIIKNLSKEEISIPKHDIVLSTIGHVLKNKGIDFIIEAAQILKKAGIDFLWIMIGKIQEPEWLRMIDEKGLTSNFMFTGILPNPYPYLRACDIYVHPSRFEGKSIALDEAKILCKPIVVTNFSTVNDQFEDRVNASICEMSGEDVAAKIMELINDIDLKNRYVDYLHNHVHDNSSEVNKLYQYLEA